MAGKGGERGKMSQGLAGLHPALAGGGKDSHLRARLPPPPTPRFRGASRSGGRGGASRLRRRPHFPCVAIAVVRSGLPTAMLCSLWARRCRRRRACGVRAPCRPGPRAFSHWRKATAGGLARDWSVAGRPRTWHVIGRAGSGLGVVRESEAVGKLASRSRAAGR